MQDGINEKGFAMSEWIAWGGGECPVPPTTVVEVQFRDGPNGFPWPAGSWGDMWANMATPSENDIIAYRVIPPVQPKAFAVGSRVMCCGAPAVITEIDRCTDMDEMFWLIKWDDGRDGLVYFDQSHLLELIEPAGKTTTDMGESGADAMRGTTRDCAPLPLPRQPQVAHHFQIPPREQPKVQEVSFLPEPKAHKMLPTTDDGWWFCFAEDISENIERSIRKNFNPTAFWSSQTEHFAGTED